jgi:hypothetical protein
MAFSRFIQAASESSSGRPVRKSTVKGVGRDSSVGKATRYGLDGPGIELPIPVAARSKAWVCGRSLTGIAGSNPTGGMDVCVVFVVRTVIWNVK